MRDDLIKAYDEMIAAQKKFLQTKRDEDLIKAREAESVFDKVLQKTPRLPLTEAEEKERNERISKRHRDSMEKFIQLGKRPRSKTKSSVQSQSI